MASTGNPNLFKTFKGRYKLTTLDSSDKYVMLSCTNDVIIMDNFTSDANKILFYLPPEVRPLNEKIVMACRNASTFSYIVFEPSGKVRVGTANILYHTKGLSFNISANFYN